MTQFAWHSEASGSKSMRRRFGSQGSAISDPGLHYLSERQQAEVVKYHPLLLRRERRISERLDRQYHPPRLAIAPSVFLLLLLLLLLDLFKQTATTTITPVRRSREGRMEQRRGEEKQG